MEDDPGQYIQLAIRLINALLWTLVIMQLIRRDLPVPRLIRELIASVILFGMWILVFGAVVPIVGIPGDLARMAYTAFTAYAAIVALGILTSRILDD